VEANGGVRFQVSDELRPLLWAAGLSAVFLALGLVLEHTLAASAAWVALVAYAAAYVAGGYLRVIDGLASLRAGSLNIDMLMVLGAVGAAVLGRWSEGAVLIFLFAASNALEEYAAGRTRQAIHSLMALRPDTARRVDESCREQAVAVEDLQVGDLVAVRPGERFPTDGAVVAGHSTVDQSPVTGESVPVEKGMGAAVYAGTLNGPGLLTVRVTHPASQSTLARVIRLVEEAQEHKARSQQLVDWIDRYYTLGVVAVAVLTFALPPLLAAWPWAKSFYLAMQLLVVMSPCALVIATPAALLSAVAAGARQGLLFKGGIHLEQAGRIRVIAFDKTGTLTEGVPRVQTVVPYSGVTPDEVLHTAAAAEAHSGHPLARAILEAAGQVPGALPRAAAVSEHPGFGVTAEVAGHTVQVGSRRLMRPENLPWLLEQAARLGEQGQTGVMVERNGLPLGVIGIADTLRPEAFAVISALRARGIERVVMLTGDQEPVARAIAGAIGIDEYHAHLLPGDKLAVIRRLEEQYGPVAMVGDGINDAPALARATLGIAMGGAGNDAALESADVVLMADDLGRLPDVFRLGRAARRVVLQNLTFAVGVIVTLVGLSLAGRLTLPLAVVGHEGSTILVAVNGMRLLLTRAGSRLRAHRAARPGPLAQPAAPPAWSTPSPRREAAD
jgi:Cd2+/Zn2+-exporting ATPase